MFSILEACVVAQSLCVAVSVGPGSWQPRLQHRCQRIGQCVKDVGLDPGTRLRCQDVCSWGGRVLCGVLWSRTALGTRRAQRYLPSA